MDISTVFGHSDYKGKQKEIFHAAVQRAYMFCLLRNVYSSYVSGLDVLVIAPTGMGKVRSPNVRLTTRSDYPLECLLPDTCDSG